MATLIWCGKEAMFKSARGDINTVSQVKITQIVQTPTPYLRAKYQTENTVVEKDFNYMLIDGNCLLVSSKDATPGNISFKDK